MSKSKFLVGTYLIWQHLLWFWKGLKSASGPTVSSKVVLTLSPNPLVDSVPASAWGLTLGVDPLVHQHLLAEGGPPDILPWFKLIGVWNNIFLLFCKKIIFKATFTENSMFLSAEILFWLKVTTIRGFVNNKWVITWQLFLQILHDH